MEYTLNPVNINEALKCDLRQVFYLIFAAGIDEKLNNCRYCLAVKPTTSFYKKPLHTTLPHSVKLAPEIKLEQR